MISQFALRLICGMSLMWALIPRRQVTSGFFRIQMLVVLGVAVLAALTAEMGTGHIRDLSVAKLTGTEMRLLSSVIALAAFAGSVWWSLERRIVGEWIGFSVLAMSLVGLTLTNLRSNGWPPWGEWFYPISQILCAAVLGSAMVGMLLGHWYLTVPTMSIEPLKHVNRLLGFSGAVRLMFSAFMLSQCFMGVRMVTEFNSTIWTWLALRWFAGLIGLLVVSWMVSRILKYRNTQAATGVLFVGVSLAFIGDLMAALLLRQTGLPL